MHNELLPPPPGGGHGSITHAHRTATHNSLHCYTICCCCLIILLN